MTDAGTTELQCWIVRLNAGDPSARAELIRRAGGRLHRLARRLLRDFPRVQQFEDADDVLQNSLIRLLRRLDAAQPATAAAFLSWVAREIRCELIDLARHYYGPQGAGRHQAPAPPAGADTSALGPVADPAQDTLDPCRLAQWTEFHTCVDRLPDDERAVFDLVWYQGLTRLEAAAVLGVSEPTVKRRWRSARLLLGAALHDGGG